ncbi:MAG: hypothetical protein IJ735_02650 [Clostridia bacterium]|nr:hypothetical protein [Clostridia bacterium]
MKNIGRKKILRAVLLFAAIAVAIVSLAACTLSDPDTSTKFLIVNNEENRPNIDTTTRDEAIDTVTDGLEALRVYLDNPDVANTGYYMGLEFNINTKDTRTNVLTNFRLKVQAHLFTYKYIDDDGNPIYKYHDKRDGKYYDVQNAEGTRELVSAESIHNEVIKKSDVLVEWYDGINNEMLIGLYYDGLNGNSEDPGNVMYLNIQGYKRSFQDWGDTVLYQQLIRLLMNLSIDKLLVAANIQGDSGTSTLRQVFELLVTDNYKTVLNGDVTSTLFYDMNATAIAETLTNFIQGVFRTFRNDQTNEYPLDPFTNKYLGFKFSVMGAAVLNAIATDMQFFTEPDPTDGTSEILTGAHLFFDGAATSLRNNYDYVSDATFEYGAYPPEDIPLDRLFYTPYEYGKYEFTGNLYIPLINANYDALIRTNLTQFYNYENNIFMEYRDIANGELMIGAYYRGDIAASPDVDRINVHDELVHDKQGRTFLDISGMEYLYGWIDLNQLGFPKVYDEHINMADQMESFYRGVNNGIVSIVDSILSPDKNDKENMLMTYLMRKMSKTEKVEGDIFSRNTETLLVDMELIKQFLRETGVGDYTTRQVINILDSMMPYTMDQIAIMLGVANAEIMLDNTYFTFRWDVDTQEIRICMYTNVNRTEEEGSLLIFQLDLVPVIVGEQVNIADLNFDNFNPLEQIYTYSATMNGNFIFSTAETVDLSKLLSATIGENSGLNTPYQLAQNAGITFRLIYDQFVTDHEVEGVMRYQGRSAFELNVWLTGAESSVIIRLASDDVAFNNDVYKEQPQRADELGYVWVSIECVTDNGIQRVPKVKIREDIFMSSMQAYMNGTKISDNAADLGNSEINLSITSILFALVEDSYVVMEPEQMEITSSNETLQNLFRVKGLIGNIRTDAGFTHRVSGLQSVKNDYGMYQVGQFENLEGNSPYDTALHQTIPVYFYEDYVNYHFIKQYEDTFDSFKPNKTSEGLDGYNLGNRPNTYTWEMSRGASGETERQRLYGVYDAINDPDKKLTALYTADNGAGVVNNVFASLMPEDFDIRAFLTIDGQNSLVMSNKVLYGQSYVKTDEVVIEAGTYYKITFKAKTLLADNVNAQFRFLLQGEDETLSTLTSLNVNTSGDGSLYEAKEYTVYVYNPYADFFKAKWSFVLGDAAGRSAITDTGLVLGMMVVDDVIFASVDEEEFAAAREIHDALDREGQRAASTRVYTYSVDNGVPAQKLDFYDPLKYDLRVDRETGMIRVYEKGGRVSIYRENIEYAADSFFNQEDANNQDISKVRFRIESLPFVYRNGDRYCYLDYEGEEVVIGENYVRTEASQTYVYFLGVQKRVEHLGGAEYCWYDGDKAVLDGNGDFVTFYTQVNRKFLFEYDPASIEITEQCKTQYAPRINGSFMGVIRRYILVFTSPLPVERGKLIELYDRNFYSEEDENHSIQMYDEDGVPIGEPIPDPIVLYVMEPCEPLTEEAAVTIQVNNNYEYYVLTARFEIDWEAVTLKGYMEVTEVTIAPGMMGEQTFPVRIIVTNRETISLDTVGVYLYETDYLSEEVPVVDVIEIDPYDYIIAKNDYFMDVGNYNPDQYASSGEDPEYLRRYREKEAEFVKQYFSTYVFNIRFDYTNSYLYKNDVKEEYIAVSYVNTEDGHIVPYDWAFDAYSEGNYTEDKIKAVADGDATHTALYLHTYFKGQLIALQVNVGTRKLSHIKFSQDDDFDPTVANPGKQPGDQGYIYGHYIANYFDADSYTVPLNPIFVFTDGAGHYYEKVFDMPFIAELADNGSYVIEDSFGLSWGNPVITYIGANGSYYYKEVWCEEPVEKELTNAKIFVEYCDDDVIGKIGDGAEEISNHTDAEIDSAILDLTDAAAEKYAALLSDFASPSGSYPLTEGEVGYEHYQAFFAAIKALFDGSNHRVSTLPEYGETDGVLLGLTSSFTLLPAADDYSYDQWLTVASRLFGCDDVATFQTALAEVVSRLSAESPINRFAFDGAVYTTSGLYVLPYAFRYNRLSVERVVLGALFVESDGTAVLWLSDREGARVVSNAADVSYDTRPTVRLYGRCQLLEFGKVLVNRPFDISHVVRDENGNVLDEGDPEEKYPEDVTSASINWFDIMSIYKPDRILGAYQGTWKTIHLIAGDETYSGFMTTVVRITVECPKLDVAEVTEGGEPVLEADDLDRDGAGNKVLFTPAYVDFGTGANPGYYFIDPLDATTLELPTSVKIGFTDDSGTRLSTHVFVNIKWRASFDKTDGQYYGDGRLVNDSGVEVLRYDAETGKYYFNQPTDEPLYTKIMAKIGSELSGYQYVVVCVRVLSKDPQEVEFYHGTRDNNTRLYAIERMDTDFLYSDADKASEFTFYTYYVDTFANFPMPTFIKAYFGANKERSAYYDVTWRAANFAEGLYYNPNSIRNMVAEIGTGDIIIYIYLSVVVANHTIKDVRLNGGLEGYYVRVGTGGDYVMVEDLLQESFGLTQQLGLYRTDGIIEDYILINNVDDEEAGLVAGMVPLYVRYAGSYVLSKQLYPYDFIEQAYSVMSISFNNGNAVDLPDVENFLGEFGNDELGVKLYRRLGLATEIEYAYDASSGKDKMKVTFRYTSGGFDYFMQPNARGLVYLSTDGGNTYDSAFTLNELAILYSYAELAKRYDQKTVARIVTPTEEYDLTGTGTTLKNLYVYDANVLSFVYEGQELSFSRIEFEDGTSAGYNELLYRVRYLERRRSSNYHVSNINNKSTVINDFEGIFYVNDVVRPIGGAFLPSDKYAVSLGTGRGAYDVKLKLVFDGGYRMTIDSEETSEIEIRPYTGSGYAQYGTRGFVFGDEILVETRAVAQDGRGMVERFYYGPDDVNKDRLDKWYVEASTFDELVPGTFILSVPQSIIYSPINGEVTVSTLTKEGFRIRRVLRFDGVPSELNEYNSVNQTGLLIRSGNINIADIYDYTPMTTYFSGTAYLPTTLEVMMGTNRVTVSNVAWKILESWYGAISVDSLGRRVGVGELDRMTYNGTYNPFSDVVSEVAMATAEILGWTDAEGNYHDRITVTLTITIPSAEIIGLPWTEGTLALNTQSVVTEDDSYRFDVEVDAFNDAGSSAVSGDAFVLPKDIRVTYRSGKVHVFRSVTYRYNNLVLTSIPYNIRGIDTAALAESFGVSEAFFPTTDHIDLTVDVGLNQILTIRFMFFDKTVDSVSAVLEPNDSVLREQVRAVLSDDATDKNNSLLASFNNTRIKKNIENMYAQARAVREQVPLATTDDIMNISRTNQSKAYIKSVLYVEEAFSSLKYASPSESVNAVKKTPYALDAIKNYVLDKLSAAAEAAAETYSSVLYDIVRDDSVSVTQRRANVSRQMDNFVAALFNNGYDAMIGDYLKLEMRKVFEEDLYASSTDFVTTAVAFKNEVEGAFEYDEVIKSIYRIRKMASESKDVLAEIDRLGSEEDYMKVVVKEVLVEYVNKALAEAKETVTTVSEETISLIENILWIKLGVQERGSSQYDEDSNVENFVSNNYSKDKKALRIALRNWIGGLFDFTIDAFRPNQIAEVNRLVGLIVGDSLNSIQNYSVTVSAIRRNLNTSVDISSMLATLLSRGVKTYVDGVYMESRIVSAIKRAQKINLQTSSDYGYYYIDPYYDFRMVPTRLVVSFDEESGGFDYSYSVNWLSDSVSGNVSYDGNKRLDWFGDLYAYYNAYVRYGENDLLRSIMLETVLPQESGKSAATIADEVGTKTFVEIREDLPALVGKTWAELRATHQTENNVMESIASYASTFFADVDDDTREARYIELYLYYRAGQALLTYSDSEIENDFGMDVAAIRRDFDRYRYDDLVANLYNTNTGENQSVSLIAEVKDRSLSQGQLVVLDDNLLAQRSYTIENPFEASASDLPHLIKVGDEYLNIIWNNVQIGPAGNFSSVSAGNNYIRGNIGNEGGQEVTLALFVPRWEYAGVYELIDGEYVLMNTGSNHVMDFYYNEQLNYSAKESYQVRFNVYTIGQNARGKYEEQYDGYKSFLFYPEDSVLLVNAEDDEKMTEVNERKNYVMYWDEMAVAQVITNRASSVIGNLFLGNESIGKHNVTTLSVGSANAALARSAAYHYERMKVDRLALATLSGEWQYSVDGTATYVTDPFDTLPETGEVDLFHNNIDYDSDKIEVRVLWNRTYNAAINALVNFIEYAFPEVEGAARTQYARSLLMDEWRTLRLRTGDVYEAALDYVRYRDASLTEEEAMRAADQLLMVNERYDYSRRSDFLQGGSYANSTVDILIRYESESNLYVEEGFRVRLVFADYSPVKYYLRDDQTGHYNAIDSIEDGTDLSDLYIGVRKKYWYADRNKDAYTVEGKNTPYDNVGDVSFKLMEEKYNVDYGTEEADGLRIVHVSDVVYESGSYRSISFSIDGVTYRSSMINVR